MATPYETLSRGKGHCTWFLQRTGKQHDATMEHPFMQTIYAQTYDRSAYGAYVWAQHRIFMAIEDAVEALKEDPILAAVYDRNLDRAGPLGEDLTYWLGSAGLSEGTNALKRVRATTEVYLNSLRKETQDPKALLCHHFLQYNAMLSGGQYLSKMITQREGIDVGQDLTGVAFYAFKGVTKPAARVQAYMRAMDGIDLSDEDRAVMLPIMRRIYNEIST